MEFEPFAGQYDVGFFYQLGSSSNPNPFRLLLCPIRLL